MNYKNKYLKYKKKYLEFKNQLGGSLSVPIQVPATQSWFVMPVLFLPFNDIQVDFPQEFFSDDMTGKSLNLSHSYNIKEISDRLRNYYVRFSVDFENRRTLEKIPNILFDDKPLYLHLSPDSQNIIMNDAGIRLSIDVIIQNIIQKYKGWGYNYYRKETIL